jgi:coenzyme F420-reducing hydrogenase delta subunit
MLLLLMGSGSSRCCWHWKAVLLGSTGKLVAFCKTGDCQFNDELLKLLQEEDVLKERV